MTSGVDLSKAGPETARFWGKHRRGLGDEEMALHLSDRTWAMVYVNGNHHIYRHIPALRRHGDTHQARHNDESHELNGSTLVAQRFVGNSNAVPTWNLQASHPFAIIMACIQAHLRVCSLFLSTSHVAGRHSFILAEGSKSCSTAYRDLHLHLHIDI